MPARDVHHNACKEALVKAGWTITHDPLTLSVEDDSVFIDLAAERLIGAERASEKIAVEVKSFIGPSDLRDLQEAVGQYLFYRVLLRKREPDRKLFLAVPEGAYINTLSRAIARPVIEDEAISVLSFDVKTEELVRWEP